MELLYREDPRRIGPFLVVAGLDSPASRHRVCERRFIARTASGDRTFVVTVPLNEVLTDRGRVSRFRAEAEQAQGLGDAVPWLMPVAHISPVGEELPWSASPYVPSLSLHDAVIASGGSLPVRSVAAIGAALAEGLLSLHARGFAHAGLSPWSVLLRGDGPLLGGFGAVRSASPDGEDRSDVSGLVAESVPPEQLTGGRPRPLGDIYALGVVLSYAASGQMTAERGELPPSLERLISACLASDPARRPQASAVLEELMHSAPRADQVASGSSVAPSATVLDSSVSRAGALLTPGWLPKGVCVELGEQAGRILAAESELHLSIAQQPKELDGDAGTATGAAMGIATTQPYVSRGAAGNGSGIETGSPATVSPGGRTSRRHLMATAASGVTGIALGGAVTWMATTEEIPSPTLAQRLAAKRTPRKPLKGASPTPRWRYEIPGRAPKFPPAIHANEFAVLVNDSSVHAVSLKTGKQLWRQSRVRPSGRPRILEDGLVLIPGKDLVALNPRTGAVRWHAKEFREGSATPYASVLAVDGSTAWFTVQGRSGDGSSGSESEVVAYDVSERSERWRSPVPVEVSEGHLSEDVLLVSSSPVPSGGDKRRSRTFIALDRRTGTVRWRHGFDGVTTSQMVTTFGGEGLVAADGHTLRGYAMKRAELEWRVRSEGDGRQRPHFGPPVGQAELAFSTDASHAVHAVDAKGKVRWHSPLERAWLKTERPPDTLVTPSGQLVLSLDEGEVIARDGRSGSVRWRFLDLPGGEGGSNGWHRAAVTDEMAVVISKNHAYALPLD